MSIKRKINILKNFLIISIIALFYTISSYNISKSVATSVSSATSVNTVTPDAHHLNLIAIVLPSNASNKAVTSLTLSEIRLKFNLGDSSVTLSAAL